MLWYSEMLFTILDDYALDGSAITLVNPHHINVCSVTIQDIVPVHNCFHIITFAAYKKKEIALLIMLMAFHIFFILCKILIR